MQYKRSSYIFVIQTFVSFWDRKLYSPHNNIKGGCTAHMSDESPAETTTMPDESLSPAETTTMPMYIFLTNGISDEQLALLSAYAQANPSMPDFCAQIERCIAAKAADENPEAGPISFLTNDAADEQLDMLLAYARTNTMPDFCAQIEVSTAARALLAMV